MPRQLIAIALLAAAASPASAQAGGVYQVRNDTTRPQNCGIRRASSEVTTRFSLRAGAEWTHTDRRGGDRILICYVGATRNTFYIAAGQRNVLREDREGRLRLGTVEGR